MSEFGDDKGREMHVVVQGKSDNHIYLQKLY